ncbi:autoinducer binding domain-containing protein [Limimaricola hongkongensis]|uniref:Response regulator receiver protein n=1 Tax=Limimaricola hongkongensis DSM 17492 TaxID=1122180 RepID=A0A017H872_9RHOB|nr:autoinducer binding domain-containing protein [Limimaricola hongkongensis]EYD70500.1 response regulator receiver protein [Limimaricola hongkongensis DSM 17492]
MQYPVPDAAPEDRGSDPARIVIEVLARLKQLAPAGFALGLHIRFMTPRYMFEAYPAEWLEIYGREGLLMRDPTVRWAIGNHGAIRWSDFDEPEENGIFARARGFGLNHGHMRSIHQDGELSFGGFARTDREFTDREIDEIGALVQRLHDATHARETLGTEASARIHDMAVVMTRTAHPEG